MGHFFVYGPLLGLPCATRSLGAGVAGWLPPKALPRNISLEHFRFVLRTLFRNVLRTFFFVLRTFFFVLRTFFFVLRTFRPGTFFNVLRTFVLCSKPELFAAAQVPRPSCPTPGALARCHAAVPNIALLHLLGARTASEKRTAFGKRFGGALCADSGPSWGGRSGTAGGGGRNHAEKDEEEKKEG